MNKGEKKLFFIFLAKRGVPEKEKVAETRCILITLNKKTVYYSIASCESRLLVRGGQANTSSEANLRQIREILMTLRTTLTLRNRTGKLTDDREVR